MAEKSGSYHHGDLRTALVAEGLEITRSTGPAALSLREVTRRAGVTPAAAYRHFLDRAALVEVLGREIQDRMVQRMRARRASAEEGMSREVDPEHDGLGADDAADPVAVVERAHAALGRLRGVGLGYIEFAVEEPGWFELAFFGDPASRSSRSAAGPTGQARLEDVPPFAELLAALDECVATGALSPARRAGAEFSCWSAVHGCAELMVHGPLRGTDPQLVQHVAERAVDDIIAGIR